MSLDALWHHHNRLHDAARGTCDALLYELRTYGVAQLSNPSCRRRLADLSTNQMRDLIESLLRLRSQYAAITDELIGVLGDQLDE